MVIIVNGEERDIQDGASVLDALHEIGIEKPEGVAVELDGRFIEREDWAAAELSQGAKMEIVRFVGGG